jgi:putative phage-type endonuclease
MKKKTRKWLEEHYQTIGGSAAPVVTGHSPFKTQAELAEEMRNPEARPDLSNNKDVKRGSLLEPVVRQLITEAMGKGCKPHPQALFQYNSDYPWAHALPDGWVGNEPVEIKCPRPQKFQKILMEGLPPDYIAQAHHNIEVMGAERLHFAILCCISMDIILVPIEADVPKQVEMMQAEGRWFQRYQDGDMFADQLPESPVVEMPEYTGTVQLLAGDEAMTAALAWLEADQLEADAKELKTLARERMTAEMNGSDVAEVPDVLRLYNKIQAGRRTFDHKAAVKADPLLERFYQNGQPFRTFRAYPIKKRD